MNRRRSLPKTQARIIFLLFMLLYFAAALWMAIRLPAQAAPNEMLHYEYIQVLRQTRQIPRAGLANTETRLTELHQPPLYYGFAAAVGIFDPVPILTRQPPPPLRWPLNPAYLATHLGNLNPVVHVTPQNTPLLYTSRVATLFIAMLGLAAFYRAGAELYSPATGLLMMSLLAFQPNFLHLSGSVNNDVPLTAITAIVFSYTLLIIAKDKEPWWFFGLGLLCAASLLIKASGIFLVAYMAIACLIVFLCHQDLKRSIQSGLYALAGSIPLWLGWLVINSTRDMDALGVANSLPVERILALNPTDFLLLAPWMDDIWRSFWLDWSAGGVGYGRDWYYVFWALFLVISLLGWLRSRSPERRWPLLMITLSGIMAISFLYFTVKALTVKEAGYLVPEGRWWLPVMPGVAWLAAIGYTRWWPIRRREQAAYLTALVPALSTLILLLALLPALYPQAQPLSTIDVEGENVILTYAGELALLEAEIEPLTTGRPSELSLTWSALEDIDQDYLVSVQLLVPQADGWQKLEEQYSFPGNGANPTKGWQAGDIYADSLLLIPEGDLNGPTVTAISVQLQFNGENMPAQQEGVLVDPPLVLITAVRPEEGQLTDQLQQSPSNLLSEPVRFGDLLSLNGLEIEEDGQDIKITFWWESEQKTTEDYTVFIHLLDQDGQLLAQADGLPNAGQSPTHIWLEGDIIRDVRRLSSLPSAPWAMRFGVYSPATGERLPAVQSGQPLPDNSLTIQFPEDTSTSHPPSEQ